MQQLELSFTEEDNIGISLPFIKISETGWGGKQGLSNQHRLMLQQFLNKVGGKPKGSLSNILTKKIYSINNFLSRNIKRSRKKISKGHGLAKTLSHLMFFELLTSIIHEFSAGTTGHLTEAFLSALIGGKQLDDSGIYDVLGADGNKFSLKVINKDTPIEGSAANLIHLLRLHGKVDYCIFQKEFEKNNVVALKVYHFSVTEGTLLQYSNLKHLLTPEWFVRFNDGTFFQELSKVPESNLLDYLHEYVLLSKKFIIYRSLFTKHPNALIGTIHLGNKEDTLAKIREYTKAIDENAKDAYNCLSSVSDHLNSYLFKGDVQAGCNALSDVLQLSKSLGLLLEGDCK